MDISKLGSKLPKVGETPPTEKRSGIVQRASGGDVFIRPSPSVQSSADRLIEASASLERARIERENAANGLAERQAIAAERQAEAVLQQAKNDEAQGPLVERSVQAAEKQANFAERAFYISIVALVVAGLALFIAAAQLAAERMS